MLSVYPSTADAGSAIWLDLLDATDDERAEAAKVLGTALPSRADLSEIESSSRMRTRDGVLYLTIPSAAPHAPGESPGSPIGFILARDRLATVRYAALKSFDAVAQAFEADDETPTCSLDVFVRLCEEIVDHVADSLEHLAEQLAPLSEAAFHLDDIEGRRAVRSNRVLRVQLRSLGRHGDRLSEVQDTLVGLARIIAYAEQNTQGWVETPIQQRMASLGQDVASLSEYDDRLFNKVQFLLDAMVGLIGIAQNDIFKVLTIVSIVGIPPTLVAGIYGMNFKGMPEYNWAWGYEYGLAVIVISAVIPLVWFKLKDWF
jgi:magnesium transporter